MPERAPIACGEPGCPKLQPCPEHPKGWSNKSRQERGYGADWDNKRVAVLERDGYLCQCNRCKAGGLVKVATEVDHIVSRAKARAMGWSAERTEDPANLQAINTHCHVRKGIEEHGGTAKPKRKIGLDGYPK